MNQPVDPREARTSDALSLRRAMATYTTGVTVVTARLDDAVVALTVNSFTSISLDPPLVMVAIARFGRSHEGLSSAQHWAVSILASGQEDVARHFANPQRDRVSHFDDVAHSVSPLTGSPLIDDALAWFECTTAQRIVAGDHTILIGAVEACRAREGGSPLTYFRGRFGSS